MYSSFAAREGTIWHRAALWVRQRWGPRLGVLNQFRPRALAVPDHYRRTIAFDDPPMVSIVTPSFNQGRYLERTLQSVLGQGYPALEYIVQDGGSRDETMGILERYRGKLQHVASGPDGGQANAINLGFRHASGEILAFLNSDDLLLPGAIPYVARFFSQHPEVDVVYGHRIVINERDEEVGRWVLPPHHSQALLWNNYIPQETLFWRRRIWEKIGGHMDESFQSALDWDLTLRFHRVGARFHRLPRFLGAFRIHPQQKTETTQAEAGLPEQKRLRERTHGRSVRRQENWVRAFPYLMKSLIYHRLFQVGILRY